MYTLSYKVGGKCKSRIIGKIKSNDNSKDKDTDKTGGRARTRLKGQMKSHLVMGLD